MSRLRIAEVGEQVSQAIGYDLSMRMEFVELNLDESVLTENQATLQAKNILNQAKGAKAGEGRWQRHPHRSPGQEVVGQIGQADQGFLGSEMFLASLLQAQTDLVGLNFGFAGATIIVMFDDVGQ